jgi:L-asparaginase
MDAISVAVRRNGIVEAVHHVHAVAVAEGLILESAGDPQLLTYTRSSSKPFQALPLVRARPDLDDRALAIAAASHVATAEQIEAVLHLLAQGPADAEELECGFQEGRPQQRIYHNCSGKHAGMIALCRAKLWSAPGYRLEAHAVQQAMIAEHSEAAELPREEIPTAVDGCGVLSFALPLDRIARAFSRLESLDGGRRIADAMRAHPELIGGPGGSDVRLMRGLSGWVSKNGAEGLACAAGPGGIGIALKSEDGTQRPLAPALSVFLGRLGLDGSRLAENPIVNSLGETVGEVREM